MDWSDETAVCDAFVEAVHAGDRASTSDVGNALVAKSFEGDFSGVDEVESGVLLTEALMPQDPDSVDDASGVALLEGLVSGERLAALVDGASLSTEELALWQQAAAEHILASIGELDWDRYSGWAVHRVRHSDGREAYLADVGGGYSFDGAWREYRGGATTLDQALAALKAHGYVSVDDVRDRGAGSLGPLSTRDHVRSKTKTSNHIE